MLLILLSSFGKGTQAIVCTYMGEHHNDGDRWVVRSAFIIECHISPNGSWRADVVACQTPKGIEMHDGDEITEDDVKFRCKRLPSGAYRMQKNYVIRNVSCEGHRIGEWWLSKKNFNKTCATTGSRIMNCLTNDGIPLGLNTSVTHKGTQYKCTAHNNGTVTLTREFPRISQIAPKLGTFHCIVNGMRKQIGETWIENGNFVKKCNERGAVTIEACFADGFTIDLNSEFTRNGKIKRAALLEGSDVRGLDRWTGNYTQCMREQMQSSYFRNF
uniref:Ig-like domain-containing protein n=1 Tax=Setaria digitata TaxID=48799 RepID=A0A915PJJ5_9BILA